MTNLAISEELGIPMGTVERYVADLYEHDNILLAHAHDTQTILTQANICVEHLLQQRNEVIGSEGGEGSGVGGGESTTPEGGSSGEGEEGTEP